MARRSVRSISVPIALAAIAVPLSVALLVGWTVLIGRNLSMTQEVSRSVWLLALGVVSFLIILSVLVMFSIFLTREILEVRRQVSFIDSVTHELKSPLASLKLCLQTLGREQPTAEQREKLRIMMLDDVDRLTSFVDDVLQASRLPIDGTGVALSEIDLEAMIDRCVRTVLPRHRIPEDAVEVQVEQGARLVTDAAALEIILKNLIDNALKYSEVPVRVKVLSYWDEKGAAVVEVRDEGIGIDKRHVKKVFNRFYRVPTEQVKRRRGTGLGLFVVSSLVRNLGGRIRAVSDGPGRGTRIVVRLPQARAA